ncbi:alpha-glucuronidase family glycosyl hydrolase [Mucilaginibacter sp. OK283]|uniref:alpha-glucuronidase family glycosyl hydrolase n=1 Tax=Mucilaginibacter sp. OK283 TaxID=1881049 RepID=UPI0008D8D411|nr:alpha-glucuronidase family glycosyl hydrolase [Mucilaginibacter sp. OK283]SEO23336.1 alpha-glucuronidase [Mucilaginibacter sp. OK283]
MAKYFVKKNRCLLILLLLGVVSNAFADDGYKLWLGYNKIANRAAVAVYKQQLKYMIFPAESDQLKAAKAELTKGLEGMLSMHLADTKTIAGGQTIIIGTPQSLKGLAVVVADSVGSEGYLIKTALINQKKCILITANTDVGVLYGVFNFLKLLQTRQPINNLSITDRPRITYRVLDHWDNLNRTVERGYAGSSIWNWHKLPGIIDQRYIDYARANASVGINGSVINNVNADALILSPQYLIKIQALANVFRAYGIKIYLSVKFSSPVELGHLKTADPLNDDVKKWWADKADEIYRYIPDFGGFLVKANSEGQPGPQTYGRSHADGANMLADAMAPHHGIVMWRAFVYDNNVPDDRSKQAYNEFKPFDGKFKDNVIIQVKNGPIDFQPREPFHPLFGAMPNTALMMEFQLTQEYLGFSTHLVYEASLFAETLQSDTYTQGKGSTVSRILQGNFNKKLITGMAGVANIGTDLNWCGHPFAQANWYAFGRIAWNPDRSPAAIADDWLKMTFTNDAGFVSPVKKIMLQSRENTVNYMTPLGLHHIMGVSTHYGPGPWVDNAGRPDWNATYYHKADSAGIGFNRTGTGSNALSQYAPQVQSHWENLQTCPDEYLLWFHHLSWTYKMRSGKSLWDEMVHHYYMGADSVKQMGLTWDKMQGKVDAERFALVQQLMKVQLTEATTWRDACVLYFQAFSKMRVGAVYPKPEHPLSYYKEMKFYYVPGIGGNNYMTN